MSQFGLSWDKVGLFSLFWLFRLLGTEDEPDIAWHRSHHRNIVKIDIRIKVKSFSIIRFPLTPFCQVSTESAANKLTKTFSLLSATAAEDTTAKTARVNGLDESYVFLYAEQLMQICLDENSSGDAKRGAAGATVVPPGITSSDNSRYFFILKYLKGWFHFLFVSNW